jgi:hypothetical protein
MDHPTALYDSLKNYLYRVCELSQCMLTTSNIPVHEQSNVKVLWVMKKHRLILRCCDDTCAPAINTAVRMLLDDTAILRSTGITNVHVETPTDDTGVTAFTEHLLANGWIHMQGTNEYELQASQIAILLITHPHTYDAPMFPAIES